MGPSGHGFLVMDASLKLIYANAEAVRILVYPENPQKIKSLDSFLTEKIRSALLKQPSSPKAGFVAELRSGRRRYLCRAFSLSPYSKNPGDQESLALQFERTRQVTLNGSQIAERFNLTPREQQTLEYLIQGLTSKEIASRMNISPNTVKAFLRLIMVKMGVTTRSGIVGMLFEVKP
jgi:DNA-binding CsgD family transcriptional regulator